MKHREFVLIGDISLELNETEHAEFFLNLQKSIIFSLEKRNLLDSTQREKCIVELERQYIQRQAKTCRV